MIALVRNYPLTNSNRNRVLDSWKLIIKSPYTNTDIKIYCLQGWVVREADGYKPPARLTTTSPIASCDGNVVTTASGSKYHLTDQPLSLDDVASVEQYITGERLNPWIEGDNWKTI